ncbi:chaplin [Streptomyces spectabilis]|uniref:Chaplin n=1 Tax=Streptomyces spectabilis TaxID=68270 RepID=A0A516RJC8_STRST|nr:chaplin [Streptomyces spectabilis]QDQ15753.1 chaplin [Streptomyces spectabilis]
MRTRVLLASAALAVTTLAGGATSAAADADANGTVEKSPGVLSGNLVQVPVDIPVNLCGNTVNVVGVLNPATGNACSDGHGK